MPAVYPGASTFPGATTYPGARSGEPGLIDESRFWANTDTSRTPGLRWLAVSLLTGKVICDLPGIALQDPLRRTLGQYESATVRLLLDEHTSPSWPAGTLDGAAALIAYRGDPGSEVIHWGGIVLRRKRTLGSNVVEMTLATPECYLDARYTGAYTTDPNGTGATKSQNTIVSDLVSQFCAANQGLPISVVTLDNGQPVPSLLEQYNDYDDKTVYSNLQALSSLMDGPEWTAHWVWDQGAGTIRPVLYVGNRIGFAVPAGLGPQAWFDSSNLLEASIEENYGKGKGANDVTAVSSGQGLARPQASSPNPPSTSLDGRPRWQYRFQPATSIQDPLTLQQHADRAYGLLGGGTNTIVLRAAASAYPRLGVDWNLGDDIGWEFEGIAFPGGLSAVSRAIGYETDDHYTSPVLFAPTVR